MYEREKQKVRITDDGLHRKKAKITDMRNVVVAIKIKGIRKMCSVV